MLGAFLSRVLPWTIATGVYICIVLSLAGISMFALVRNWLPRRHAIFAAALYTANPYHLVIVYWRSAFAELLAACLIPLLVLLILRVVEERWRALPALALLLAAAWLTNAPAAVMINYSMVLLLVVIAWRRRAWGALWIGAAAVLLGAALAGFYLLPAIYEQRWIEIAQSISAGSRPQDNFLFVHTSDADHDAFNRIVSWLAMTEITILAIAAWTARNWRKQRRDVWDAMMTWGVGCILLLFPITKVVWEILPKMRYMQFPWRWLLCLSMVMCLFVAIGLQRWWSRVAVCVAMLLVIVFAWNRIQAPWWDTAADLREMQDNMETGAGYEGTDEYTPLGADPSGIDKDARKVTGEGPARAAIRVFEWNAESKSFVVETSAADRLAVRLFDYPAWRVEVNGHATETGKASNGQMLIPVEPGTNRVRITFIRTWDRIVGAWISVLALAAVGVLLIVQRRRGDRGTPA